MAGDTVQQIKGRLSIVDAVSQYVKLERAGGTLRARCPFHAEKTPSFFVSADRGTYHCFGCGVGGDIFSFIEAIEGLDFKGALKILAEKTGVPLVYERSEKKDERERLFELMETATIFYASRLDTTAKVYLERRGVLETTMHSFRIGWSGNEWSTASDYLKNKKFSDKEIIDAGLAKKNERGGLTDKFRNRIMFPIADSAGRIVAFSGRSFGEHASAEAPKYLNSPETPLFRKSRILYGFDRAKLAMRKANCAVLVEGQMDLILSHQAGWSNTLAASGTAFTEEHANLIKRMTDNLVLALDADEAGIKAAGRAARAALASGLNVKVARLPAGLDPADLILEEGPDAWRAAIREAKDIITFLLDVLQEHAPQQDRFRRAVESAVLPFLTEVKSPIAREQYVREISHRLGVSQEAVVETLARLPSVGDMSRASVPTRALASTSPAENLTRTQHALALLLWQSSLPKPHIDIKKFRTELKDALGKEASNAHDKLTESEREALRFSAERLYGENRNVPRAAAEILKVMREDRLRRELAETTRELERAEASGKEDESARLLERSKILTGEIARLHEQV